MKKTFIVILGILICLSSNTYAVPLTAEHLYTFARQKNETLLYKYSPYINITNKNNDTAICIAAKSRDKNSFNLLKKYGASTKVECLQKMLSTALNANSTVSDGTFLGMGKLGWGALGVAAVGGGIAAASGGGSGGGNKQIDKPLELNCQHGIQSGDICLCDKGYVGSLCENKVNCEGYYQTCPEGYEKGSNTCQSGKDILYKCDIAKKCPYTTTACSEGYHETGKTCQSGTDKYVECEANSCIGFDHTLCPTGYKASASCLAGNTYKYQCDNCAEGWIKQDGVCIAIKQDDIVGSSAEANNDEIKINNSKYADIYGMKNLEENRVFNAKADFNEYINNMDAIIDIKNMNNGNIYGIFSEHDNYNAYMNGVSYSDPTTGTITIDNKGNGNVYGLYSENGYSHNAYNILVNSGQHERNIVSTGKININNIGNGNIYGIKGNKDIYNAKSYNLETFTLTAEANGQISINNTGNGDVYGIMTTGEYIYNTYGRSDDSGYTKIAKGTIYINNNGAGNVYGLYAPKGTVFNSDIVGEGVGEGYIEIINNKGNSYGLYGKRVYQANTSGQKRGEGSNYSSIKIANIGNGTAIGMYGTDEIINSGDITIHNLRDGTAVGIYADGANTQNRGTITITRDKYIDNKTTEDTADDTTYTASNSKGGLAIGIYGTADSQISNTGTINISGATNAYGIYSEGGTVENTGTIQIDGNSSHPNAIKLNGGKLFQDGMLVSQNLSLNDFGGEVVASENSKFIAENNISGDLSVSNSLVKDGFDKTYTAKDVINASDTSDLHLNSKSALFNAELAENNSDIVMKMKDFNDVVDNKSVAGFLGDNYNEQNNEKLFNSLKGIENTKALNKTVDDMTGKQMFNRFAFEDLSQIREFNADMNNKLFNNQEKILSTSGNVSPWMLNGASDSQTKYSLNNMTIGNNSIGLAIALTDTNSKDNQGQNSRHDKTYQMAMPVGYSAYGFNFITTPSVGYSYGTYNRQGFEYTTYKGTVEKQMFGLMNEARYPFMLAGWNLNLALEFNVIGYRISGDEGSRDYGLNIAEKNTYSVETGIGLYANKDIELSKNSRLKLYNGVAMYHEFADPYKMKIGMNGMSGTYTLRDENRGANRAVMRTGFDYTHQDLSFYGSLSSYIDHELQTNADLGLKYNF